MSDETKTREAIERTAARMVDHAQRIGQSISTSEARERARLAVLKTENKARR